MKQVTYAGKVFLTGDDIADALFETVAALGASDETRTVEIPAIVGDNQSKSVVSFVIGPSSEIIAMPADWEGDELVDDAAVQHLHQLTQSTNRVSHPVAGEAPIAFAADSESTFDAHFDTDFDADFER
jgi:hypothetical protein